MIARISFLDGKEVEKKNLHQEDAAAIPAEKRDPTDNEGAPMEWRRALRRLLQLGHEWQQNCMAAMRDEEGR